MDELTLYKNLLLEIKQRIGEAQTRALLAVNAELIQLYWDIGQIIDQRQRQEGWGAGIIPRLAIDLHNELPEMKGFSERNLKRMLAFYRAYRAIRAKVPQPWHFCPILRRFSSLTPQGWMRIYSGAFPGGITPCRNVSVIVDTVGLQGDDSGKEIGHGVSSRLAKVPCMCIIHSASGHYGVA